MKKIISLLSAYLVICFAGTILGAALYLLYMQGTAFVFGITGFEFSLAVCKTGILLAFPVVLLLSFLFLTLFIIRHPVPVYGMGVFYLLGAITWGILFPTGIKLMNRFPSENVFSAKNYASGYFKKSGSAVYYFAGSKVSNSLTVVKFNIGNVNSFENLFPEVLQHDQADLISADFNENLFEDILVPPFFVRCILKLFSLPQLIAANYSSNADYIYICSLGFALVLIGVMNNLSQWRLINILNSITGTTVILFLNASYFTEYSLVSAITAKFNSISLPFNVSFIVAINAVIALLLVSIGIITMFTHKRRGQ